MRNFFFLFLFFSAIGFSNLIHAANPQSEGETDEESVVWNTIKDTKSTGLLRAFVETYPKSKFAGIATSLISILESGVATAPTSIDTKAEETKLWNSAKNAQSPEELQRYIDAFPNGRYAALAKHRLASLALTIDPARNDIDPGPANEKPLKTAHLHPFDGNWRLTGKANSFKRFKGGICQNPDSINTRLAITDGKISKTVQSKSRNTAKLDGTIDNDGIMTLNITSREAGWDRTGQTKVKMRKNGGATTFTVVLKDAGSSGCNYDFKMRLLR